MSTPALEESEYTPATAVLKTFLGETIRLSIANSQRAEQEVERRTDILFALTDGIAHRRALPFTRLGQEVRKIEPAEILPTIVTDDELRASLRILVHHRLVRQFDSGSETHYELAHDFLVRFVVQKYRELDRERIAAIALLRGQRQASDEELARLTKMGLAVSWLLRLLPILTFSLAIGLLVYALNEHLPEFIGLSYFWVLALPGSALLLIGIAARRFAAVSLALLVLICCAGSWFHEYSAPLVDAASLYGFPVLSYRPVTQTEQIDWCELFAISVGSALMTPEEVYLSRCNNVKDRSYANENVKNMVYNARGLQAYYPLSRRANFCFDLSQVFGQGRESQLWRACWQHTPDWSFYLARATTGLFPEWTFYKSRFITRSYAYEPYPYESGLRLPRYQVGQLFGSSVWWFAFILLVAHVLLYPAVLIGTTRNDAISNMQRRISSGVSDVVLPFTTLIGMYVFIFTTWSLHLTPMQLFLLVLPVHATICLVAFVPLSVRKRTSVGALLVKLVVTDSAGSFVVSSGRLIARAVLLWAWGVLPFLVFYPFYQYRVFQIHSLAAFLSFATLFLLPTLVITTFYVWLRSDHQLVYDVILKLRTEPKHSVESSIAEPRMSSREIASSTETG
jgi:hypothetical protein